MNLSQTLITLFEIAFVAVVLWAVFHEDRFIAFEEKLFASIRRRRMRVIRGSKVGESYYPQAQRTRI